MALKRSIIAAKPMRQLAAPRVTNADASVQLALDGLAQELSPIVASPVLQGRIFDANLDAAINKLEHGLGRPPQMCLVTVVDAASPADVAWLPSLDTSTILHVESTATVKVRLWVF